MRASEWTLGPLMDAKCVCTAHATVAERMPWYALRTTCGALSESVLKSIKSVDFFFNKVHEYVECVIVPVLDLVIKYWWYL